MLGAAVALAFALSLYQGRQLVGRGSDHPVHVFLAEAIRANGHRLFVRVPRLLNDAYCSGYPIFLHWVLSFLSRRQMEWVAFLLNPTVNALQVVVAYGVARSVPLRPGGVAWFPEAVALAVSLTPQFFHANSARNYGISARPVGMLLLQLTLMAAHGVVAAEPRWLFAALAILCAYGVWGTSTFSQQALVLLSTAFGLAFGSWTLMAAALAGLAMLFLLHPRYASAYLTRTLRFIRTYATDLAERFVLRVRHSIWRDLVFDIWIRLRRSAKDGLRYAYENAFVIVVLLNPLSLLAVGALWRSPGDPVMWSGELAVCALGAFLLTSMRPTRFLGEPERYVEQVTAITAVAGVWVVAEWGGQRALVTVLAYFAGMNLVQLLVVPLFRRREATGASDLRLVAETVRSQWDEPVRFVANNEQLTKFLMTEPWSFARIWSAEEGFGGVSLRDAVTTFPYLRREPFERAVQMYQINACLLDKANFEDLAEQNLRRVATVVLETERYRLYRIRW